MPASAHLDASAAATWGRVKQTAVPALLFDVVSDRLVDANAEGLALWCRSRAPMALPAPIDAAMPAWITLRAAPIESSHETAAFCFWTPAGALTCNGLCTSLGDGRHVAVVVPVEAARAAPRDETGDDTRAARNAKLAHELRTPIGAVAAYAEVLAGEHFGPLGNARYRAYAQHMRDGAMHALGVIEGMMGTSRDDGSARRELRFRDVDPGEVARNCLSVIRPIADAADVRLEMSVPDDLPRIIADDVSLRQMLLNLLTNAVKFARPSDRVTLGVTYDDEGTLTFAVEDTGPGLAATRRPEAPSGKGLGLGLPLTRELAEANGAALAIESAPGHGTRASISFSHTRVVV